MAGFLRALTWRDWALPAALLVGAQLEIWAGTALVVGPPWLLACAALGAAAALVARRLYPLVSLTVVLGVLACPLVFGWLAQSTAMVLMAGVALFACGRYARRPMAYLAVPLTALFVLAESVPDPDQELADAWGWSLNTIWVFALGAAFRHERRLRDRAAEASEARARATNAEERLRLAQDVHDVLSHNLAVVVVQAEVADAFLATDPDRSRGAIRNVAATGRSALEETRRLVQLLRDSDSAAPGPLPPGLGEVDSLVARVSAAGLPIRLQMDTMPPLSDEVAATAYRVVQESLTNVLRHAGPVPTSVTLLLEDHSLVVEVLNDEGGRLQSDSRDGHGLRGMRERVLSCGGELTSGPNRLGGFRVRAVLPTGQP